MVSDANNDGPVFTKPQNLMKKVKYSEKGIDEKKLAKAEEVVAEEMKQEYVSSIDNDLVELEKVKKQLLADPAGRDNHVRRIFELVHKIRGQGGSFGYQMVTIIGDKFCDFLEENPKLSNHDLAIAQLYIDTLRTIILQKIDGDGGTLGQEIVRGLDAVIAKTRKKS